ncbi:MAG: hypothetical protein CME21_11540 [Gemmatimonadetes bacterium]|nr:hypothetical protein [Gemmatimonadota bacterium]HCK09729.1 hypothetical protein [Candidatus Latescibacterota bacterium]
MDATVNQEPVGLPAVPSSPTSAERFADLTGVPVVLNTSFNLQGEPIVTTPANAYSPFVRSQMDALVMGHFVVTKSDS